MLNFGFYNMDCMEGMKEFPDNYFDLAVVDPPYGGGLTDNGGCQGWFSKYHQQDPVKDIGGARGSAVGSTSTNKSGGASPCQRTTKRQPQLRETQAGRRTQKNHIVGYCAGARIFRGIVPYLTQSDHLGRELLFVTADKMFSDMAQTVDFRGFFNGYVRVRVDII